jgi:NAD-dependent dihydropyrimidine dehydrogenase PreA subunit
MWHGIPRQEIPWYPTVNKEACIGCELCYLTCGREVYEIDLIDGRQRKAKPERPSNCMVGCSTCAVVCPTQAISFPSRDVVWKLEREHKIFAIVHEEAKEKRDRATSMAARQKAEEQLEKSVTRIPVRVAGVFGEKRFVAKLEEWIKDRPCDIENLVLSIPTLKGLMTNTPVHMSFELTSTTQQDVHQLLDELKKVVADNDLVWVDATKQP